MSELKNSFHTQLAIGILLQDEETLDDKLNLLTTLSIECSSRETFRICEGIREHLCREEIPKERANDSCGKHQGKSDRDSWKEISDAPNGVE